MKTPEITSKYKDRKLLKVLKAEVKRLDIIIKAHNRKLHRNLDLIDLIQDRL